MIGNCCERRITPDDNGIYIKANGWVRRGQTVMIRKIAMYALVKTGGKQYRVAKDDTILVERIAADEGAEVILNDIVMLADGDKVTIGTPKVEGAAVSATVMRQTRGPKIIIFRRKRRKNHRRTQGHRQDLTLLKINDIAEDAKKLRQRNRSQNGSEKSRDHDRKRREKASSEKSCGEKASAKSRRREKASRKESGKERLNTTPHCGMNKMKGVELWHIKKQVVAPETVAIRLVVVLV
jgi:large subunit ribosomal protein L21